MSLQIWDPKLWKMVKKGYYPYLLQKMLKKFC